MNKRRIWAMARKEFLHVVRDPRSLAMAIVIPMMMLVLFGYALTLDVDNVPLVVWDQSETPASRELVAAFAGSRYFGVRAWAGGYEEIERAIDTREAIAGLVIPRDFSQRLEVGRTAAAQLIVDGSDANTATLAIGYANAVAEGYAQQVALEARRRAGRGEASAPIDLRSRVWFNEELLGKNYVIPGLIAVIMMVIAAMLTSGTVAREWERNTMEPLLSTPLTAEELVAGKLIPYFAIGMLDVLLAVLMAEFVFEVPFRGQWWLLLVASGLFLAGSLAFGMIISIVARTQLLAHQMAMMTTFLPAFLLSGFMFPIRNMPEPLEWVSLLVPARYFMTVVRGIYLKGVGLEVLAGDFLLLVLFAVGLTLVAMKRFRKKLM